MIQTTCESVCRMVEGKLYGKVSDAQLMIMGVSTDTRTLQTNQLFIPLVGERFNGHQFLDQAVAMGAAAALWQKDQPMPKKSSIPLLVVEDTLVALQTLAACYRRETGVKVVGVTGSNGKTTTKDLIGSVLAVKYRVHRTQGNLNNHIGLPLTILSMPRETEIAVLEMGMNHTGEISALSRIALPDVAVVTNIGEAHLEYLGSREAIADAKLEIRDGLSEQGLLIVDGDEPLLKERLARENRQVIRVGWNEENDDRIQGIRLKGTQGINFTSFATGHQFELPLMGKHNALNALLAVAVGRHFGMKEKEIQKGLQQSEQSGMRLETQMARNGMTIINDAYNASPTAMKATIDLLMSLDSGKEKWVLLADMLELGSKEEDYHREVGRYAVMKGVHRIYTYGERGHWIAQGAREAKGEQVNHFQSVEEAAAVLSHDGGQEVILLAKASRGALLENVIELLKKGENEH